MKGHRSTELGPLTQSLSDSHTEGFLVEVNLRRDLKNEQELGRKGVGKVFQAAGTAGQRLRGKRKQSALEKFTSEKTKACSWQSESERITRVNLLPYRPIL